MTTKQKLLIDTDPGVDDALALLMALRHPRAEVVGITVTAGNVGLTHTTRNALTLVERCGLEVPVFVGADRPLVWPAVDAAYVHGSDGFGDAGLEAPTRAAQSEHAVQAILRLSREYAGELTLVTLGPLTNLALALRLDPSLPERIPRLVVMGAAVTGLGNITPSAEFNIYFDPEAAKVVFDAWPAFELVDWEATLAHAMPDEQFGRWLAEGGELARFYDMISAQTRAFIRAHHADTFHSADALAMAVVLEPEIGSEVRLRRIEVEVAQGLYRGATRVDWDSRDPRGPNAAIVGRIDPQRLQVLLRRAIGLDA
ncbi:nucleoside hydrolase [uncultured Aquimonas sp.]|uniref:nucleoside hydrolase n=1 Tax=uncultured Aquimonas sp. TaxID=385483 RepID=UPI00086854F8|nr:nucleoside hydrolase [uncultured Aquimonas sp.]ODU44564.1 MAG: nucleoside hydrolase [Xanthomonadaceae bacterium SCN 69-123]